MMDVQEAVALLRRFNAWRCGAAHLPYDAEEVAPDPRKVTKAIDTVCAELAKREAVAVPDGFVILNVSELRNLTFSFNGRERLEAMLAAAKPAGGG